MSDDLLPEYGLIAPHLPSNHPQNVERRLRDALARKDAEIAELRARAERAEAGVREAQQRIAEAPTMIYGQSAALGGMPFSLNGKRVALVVVND